MKKKIKKIAQSNFHSRGYDSQVYQNYDLETRLVQNINKETPQYSLE